MCIKNQYNEPHSTGVFYCDIFHLHVSAGISAKFRVAFLLQEYSVIKSLKLFHNI